MTAKARLLWAGFCNDTVDVFNPGIFPDGYNVMGIFKTRAAAKRYYEDVRRVRITEHKPKRSPR